MLNGEVILAETNQIKFRHVYKCHGCSFRQIGESGTVDIQPGFSIDDQINRVRPNAHGMPVGWASFYPSLFYCPNCKQEPKVS